jgi:hypothetical protein
MSRGGGPRGASGKPGQGDRPEKHAWLLPVAAIGAGVILVAAIVISVVSGTFV